MSKSFHHPGGLAKFAAMQGAGLLLGPFGYGITAYEYLTKNGGDTARTTAIELISQNRTEPIRQELLGATLDKDPGVRLASAKALSKYKGPDVADALAARAPRLGLQIPTRRHLQRAHARSSLPRSPTIRR
jgi:hypothetical protein